MPEDSTPPVSGIASSPPHGELLARSASELSTLKSDFESTGASAVLLRSRTGFVDSAVRQLYSALISSDLEGPDGLCLAAVGGYGRGELFPYSDLDLLFASRDPGPLKAHREGIASLARHLWDLQMRVAHSARTLEDCGRLHGDNLEFSVSLLDARYLAGDRRVFEDLCTRALLHLVVRDGQDLARNLVEKTLERHAKHGQTIFHLEPDVKEAPGGLRDYHVSRWLAMIAEMSARQALVRPDELWPPALRQSIQPRFEFLSAVRSFLHFQRGRDDNLLTYELHEKAAALGLGVHYGEAVKPAEWMRSYYVHVRAIYQLVARAIEDARPSRSSLYGLFQDWRSRLSNADFSVIRGNIFPRSLTPGSWPALLGMFELMARHSLALSREAERWVEESLAVMRAKQPESVADNERLPGVWPALRRMLVLPGAAAALRALHRLGGLCDLLPEFRAIDALVIRDFFHKYTVDEHTFMAIQTLCELKIPRAEELRGGWTRRFGDIFSELEQPGTLALALLLHDVGKGMPGDHHAVGSLRAAATVCARLELDARESGNVHFLIHHHLEMSSTVMRRDIFDPETIRQFAQKVGATERLKMLSLLTFADVSAVNPEAMTPWKAEMLWQLYAMTANYLSRSIDQDRLESAQPSPADPAPLAEKSAGAAPLETFLEGFPRRYLATHSPSEVGEHFEWARRMAQNPIQVKVRRRESFTELTVLTTDRPFLFASITGALAAWGMNILKAEAFANHSGVVLDVFQFHDLHRTLELNPSEVKRLEDSVRAVLAGSVDLSTLMRGRMGALNTGRAKVATPTQVNFDDTSSLRCTILELIAQDRPGLLYRVSTALAQLGCSIEVALIETEAQKALDVFYITTQGSKLSSAAQQAVREAILSELS